MSLRWRLALILAGIVLVTVTAVAGAAWVSASTELMQGVDDQLRDRVSRVGRPGDFFGRFEGRGGSPFGPLIEPDTVLQVIDDQGTILLVSGDVTLPVTERDVELASSASGEVALQTTSVDGTNYRVATTYLGGDVAIQLGRDLTEIEAALLGLRRRLIGIGLVASAVAAAFGWLVARRTVQPIEQLSDTAEHVAVTQELDAAIVVDRDDEVGRLATSFNQMMTALDSSREQQRRLVSDAGHELRTPLTTLRTNLEVMQRRTELDEASRSELIDSSINEVGELTQLVTELVDLATDARRSSETPVTASLDELAEPVVARANRRSGRNVVMTGSGRQVTIRRSQFERALGNLIENAAKWSQDGEQIDVVVQGTTISVRDRGPGIAEADLPRVFDRFFRAETARTMPGSGLGLAIVRQAAEAHGGSVFARNHPDGGAEVGFTLPPAGDEAI